MYIILYIQIYKCIMHHLQNSHPRIQFQTCELEDSHGPSLPHPLKPGCPAPVPVGEAEWCRRIGVVSRAWAFQATEDSPCPRHKEFLEYFHFHKCFFALLDNDKIHQIWVLKTRSSLWWNGGWVSGFEFGIDFHKLPMTGLSWGGFWVFKVIRLCDYIKVITIHLIFWMQSHWVWKGPQLHV